MAHDVVGVGEVMLRLWVPVGRRLEDAPALEVSVGGAEANVAVAVARMGASAAWLSTLPDNPLGRRASHQLASHGVDVSHVQWVDGARMGTYYLELSDPPRSTTVIYDRAGSAAAGMDSSSIHWPTIENARLVHLSGITPALSPSCRAMSSEIVQRARAAGTLVSIDVNYRRGLWTTAECRTVLEALAAGADLVIATAEDARRVFGLAGDPGRLRDGLKAETGASHVVITAGGDGASWASGERRGHTPSHPAAIVDRIGAGDAFAAGTILGLLEGDLAMGVARGLAMAALKLGILGDHLTSRRAEVEQLQQRGDGGDVTR